MYRDELFEGDQREEEERVDQVQIIDIFLNLTSNSKEV